MAKWHLKEHGDKNRAERKKFEDPRKEHEQYSAIFIPDSSIQHCQQEEDPPLETKVNLQSI